MKEMRKISEFVFITVFGAMISLSFVTPATAHHTIGRIEHVCLETAHPYSKDIGERPVVGRYAIRHPRASWMFTYCYVLMGGPATGVDDFGGQSNVTAVVQGQNIMIHPTNGQTKEQVAESLKVAIVNAGFNATRTGDVVKVTNVQPPWGCGDNDTGVDIGCGSTTYVTISYFCAHGQAKEVVIYWTTASEIDNAGFNLHRGLSKEEPYTRINDQLIPAQGDELQGATYSFTDEDVTPGLTSYYWLEDVNLQGRSTMHGPVSATPTSAEEREEVPIPTVFSLAQNYPNPFNTTTEIKYGLPVESDVNLTIYNLIGQKVKTLVNEPQTAGYKVARWDGRNEKALEVSSGIYFYRLQAGSYTEIRKMVLLK